MSTARTRTAILAGNWKMNYGPAEATNFAREIVTVLTPLLRTSPGVLGILCPPAISLSAVREVLDSLPTERLELGAQNMYFEEKGAYTGEIAPGMVRELCTTVILGHSERRSYFGESDQLVNKKALAALAAGVRPIVCIGENLQQYEANQTEQIIGSQVHASLANLPDGRAGEVVIAYEPIWAIGTGRAATADGALRVIRQIRQLYQGMYGEQAASALRILYGGSVTSANIADFMAHPEIDGALVGGASIKQDFVEIVRQTAALIEG